MSIKVSMVQDENNQHVVLVGDGNDRRVYARNSSSHVIETTAQTLRRDIAKHGTSVVDLTAFPAAEFRKTKAGASLLLAGGHTKPPPTAEAGDPAKVREAIDNALGHPAGYWSPGVVPLGWSFHVSSTGDLVTINAQLGEAAKTRYLVNLPAVFEKAGLAVAVAIGHPAWY